MSPFLVKHQSGRTPVNRPVPVPKYTQGEMIHRKGVNSLSNDTNLTKVRTGTRSQVYWCDISSSSSSNFSRAVIQNIATTKST